MKSILLVTVLAALVGAGCASSSVEKRRGERSAAYQALPEDQRSAVDQGQIKVGMTQDAVYIALGKPHEVLEAETPQGKTVTWLYHGHFLQEYRYWTYHQYAGPRGRTWGSPYLATDYDSRRYVSTEVTFQNGTVLQWRSLPAPHY